LTAKSSQYIHGHRLDGPGIESRWGRDFVHPSRTAMRLADPPVQWVLGLCPGVKPPGRCFDHPPPASAEVTTPSEPSWFVTEQALSFFTCYKKKTVSISDIHSGNKNVLKHRLCQHDTKRTQPQIRPRACVCLCVCLVLLYRHAAFCKNQNVPYSQRC
jgi:hypothetical protein